MLETIINDFLILWTTIDPFGTLAIFAGLTGELSKNERRHVAKKSVIYAGTVLIFTMLIGQLVLAGMGIRLISMQVAGGIILFLFSIKMIFGGPTMGISLGKSGKPEEGHDIAVFPLAIPGIATPGAIMAVILLTDSNLYTFGQQIITMIMLIFVLFLTYQLLRFSEIILRVIGKNGALILVKVMGMLLAALSVELIMEAIGIERWIKSAF